jgi:flagellar motility protein MotE (MotC chaperone)
MIVVTDEELKSLFDALGRENTAMRRENAAGHAETRRYFDVTAESVRNEIRFVAEAVAQLEEKVDRETESIREEMRQGFADTQAMIKFSHAELERRVRALEQAFSDLQARVERLEGTTTH